jgi:HK97 gp10 family phage protein
VNGDLEIKGLDELRKRMEATEPAVRKKLMRKALRAGAKVIANQCKADAPVKSGLLRSKIKVRSGKRKRDTIRMLVAIGKKDFQGQTFYGGMVDRGHKTGKRGSKNRKQIPGTLFLEKAFEKARKLAAQMIFNTLKGGLTPDVAKREGGE